MLCLQEILSQSKFLSSAVTSSRQADKFSLRTIKIFVYLYKNICMDWSAATRCVTGRHLMTRCVVLSRASPPTTLRDAITSDHCSHCSQHRTTLTNQTRDR